MLLTPNADRKFPVIEAFVIIIILLENWTFQKYIFNPNPRKFKEGRTKKM